jgi:hypothetical protein
MVVLSSTKKFQGDINGAGDCNLELAGEGYGRIFEFDLDTLERNYYVENANVDLCSNAGESSSEQFEK